MARLLTALAALTAAAAFAPPAAQRAATRLRAEPDARTLDAPRALDRRAAAAGLAAAAATAAAPRAVADQVVSASAIQKTKGGVKYVIVKEGKCPNADPTGLAGSCVPTTGSFCIIDYTGFLPSGEVFDSTEKKGGKPLAFRLGDKQVIVGIEQVVSQMKPGEEVQALVPAELAYGEKGVCTEGGECLIKPNMNLKYFIRLNRVAQAAG
jgi:FKBP-type peptidyl-prolyl cis-trans isomerase